MVASRRNWQCVLLRREEIFLDSDRNTEVNIEGLIYRAHTALAEHAFNSDNGVLG